MKIVQEMDYDREVKVMELPNGYQQAGTDPFQLYRSEHYRAER